MESNEMEVPVDSHRELTRGGGYGSVEPSIGELFRRLGTDTGTLIRAEATLAKAEARETAARVARDAAKVGVAAALALVGVIALSAFLIIGLGMLLGGAWWLSALSVGACLTSLVELVIHVIDAHGSSSPRGGRCGVGRGIGREVAFQLLHLPGCPILVFLQGLDRLLRPQGVRLQVVHGVADQHGADA